MVTYRRSPTPRIIADLAGTLQSFSSPSFNPKFDGSSPLYTATFNSAPFSGFVDLLLIPAGQLASPQVGGGIVVGSADSGSGQYLSFGCNDPSGPSYDATKAAALFSANPYNTNSGTSHYLTMAVYKADTGKAGFDVEADEGGAATVIAYADSFELQDQQGNPKGSFSQIDTDSALTANSDTRLVSQKAIKSAIAVETTRAEAAEALAAQKSANLSDLANTAAARTNLGVPAGSGTSTGTNTGDQTTVSGNAGTATALQTARNIDGQSFNGTADITVIAPGTHAATSKATPVDADELPLVDSAASNVLKKLTWANLKATAKAYFDTLYDAAGAAAAITTITGNSGSATKLQTARALWGNNFDGTAAISAGLSITPAANTSALLVNSHTQTTSNPAINIAQTWNAGGVVFTADFLNVTNTASAAGSLLVDRQVGGVSVFNVDKTGAITVPNSVGLFTALFGTLFLGPSGATVRLGASGSYASAAVNDSGFIARANMPIGWSANNILPNPGAWKVALGANATDVVEVNNGTLNTLRDLKLRNLLAGGGNGSYVQTPSMTVANLAAAATAGAGARAFVTDATTTLALGIGVAVTGGGSNKVPVYSDGSSWLIG